MFEAKSTTSFDHETVSVSLQSMLWVGSPTLFVCGLATRWIDHPYAAQASIATLATAVAYTFLAFWWSRRPPKNPHFAVALAIGLMQLCLVAQLVALRDPVTAPLQIIIAIGTAFFLRDLRWMLSIQILGLACWLLATVGVEPTSQWQMARLVTLGGYAAAAGIYLSQQRATDRLQQLHAESHALGAEAQASNRALQASEQRLQTGQRIARTGSFEWDLESNELHWSDEHYRIFGWEPGEIHIDNALFIERVHPDDRDAVGQAVLASLRHGTPVDIEFRINGADGEERILAGRGETSFDDSGKPVAHCGATLDITQRFRTEQALRASEQRIQAVLTAMDTIHVALVSRDGMLHSILADPPGRTDRYGVEGGALVGKSIEDLVPGEDGRRVGYSRPSKRSTRRGAPGSWK